MQASPAPGRLHWTAIDVNTVQLSWSRPAGARVPVLYSVFRDGTEIGRATGTSFVDAGASPGRTYSYSVRAIDESGGASAESDTIKVTALISPSAILVGAGDIAYDGPNDEDTARLVDKEIAAHPDAVVFTAGDNAYPSGSAESFRYFFDPSWGRHKFRTRPVPGNHDYQAEGAAPYYDYFGAAAGETGKGYYSYDLGSWHIVALNSEIATDETSPQMEWLREDLATRAKPCTLAVFHRPLFSSGSEEGDGISTRSFWDVLYQHGVDVVVNGHQHSYERFDPQTPEGAADAEHGIREFVIGTGGVSLYDFRERRPNSAFQDNRNYGIMKLILKPEGYTWQYIVAGRDEPLDSGDAECSATLPPSSWKQLEFNILSSADDAMEFTADHKTELTSTGVYLGSYSDGQSQTSALRFTGVDIPSGATIVSAYIQVTARDTNTDPTEITITGEASPDSARFQTALADIARRPRSGQAVTWDVPAWKEGESGDAQRTPSVSAIVNENMLRPGWKGGGAMSFFFSGTGSRVARSFDNAPAEAPRLVIVFSPPR
jgi:acid phosphatase type 7